MDSNFDLGNLGNYKSFGDSKFIPRLSKEQFTKIISCSGAKEALDLWNQCQDATYSLRDHEKSLGIPPQGISTYYSENISKKDMEIAQEVLDDLKIEGYNTRLFHVAENQLEIRLACVEKGERQVVEHKGYTVKIIAGDHSQYMARVVENLKKALEYAADENQKEMIAFYVDHFTTGDIRNYKDAQRRWVKDIGPVVESNIGFIESYRDPFGVRAEWEGLVSIVDKESSEKFNQLVQNAEGFIEHLPWPSTYEKDKFLRPDFTSLEVITFASSGIPAGINLPNFDDIRQDFGFKNVSLGNVLRASKSSERVTFIRDEDQEKYQNLLAPAFEVQVGIHELLGHGSGKLFVEDESGNFNFDKNTMDPLTNKPVTSWYKGGKTYDSIFSSFASAMEECRAEACGIYLCLNRDLLKIFGHQGEGADDIIYINWLNMVRAGLLALEFYTPDTKKWRQAHMQARFSILKVLLNAGEGFVQIVGEDENLEILLDRSKIETVGKKAIGHYLLQLQVYKATADIQGAETVFMGASNVDEMLLKYRDVVLAKKKPRRQFVQCRTVLNGNQVELREFEATPEGMN